MEICWLVNEDMRYITDKNDEIEKDDGEIKREWDVKKIGEIKKKVTSEGAGS
jgi:hypothetical protein